MSIDKGQSSARSMPEQRNNLHEGTLVLTPFAFMAPVQDSPHAERGTLYSASSFLDIADHTSFPPF